MRGSPRPAFIFHLSYFSFLILAMIFLRPQHVREQKGPVRGLKSRTAGCAAVRGLPLPRRINNQKKNPYRLDIYIYIYIYIYISCLYWPESCGFNASPSPHPCAGRAGAGHWWRRRCHGAMARRGENEADVTPARAAAAGGPQLAARGRAHSSVYKKKG